MLSPKHWLSRSSKNVSRNGVARRARLAVEALEVRETPASVDAREVFLQQAYLDLLDRPIVSEELNQWTSAFDAGNTRKAVAIGISKAEVREFHNLEVEQLTFLLLHRDPTPDELSSRARLLNLGAREAVVASAIAGTREYWINAGSSYPGFVDALYQDALGRAPQPEELTRGLKLLSQGTSRADFAKAIFKGAEYYGRLMEGYYEQVLDRSASSTELAGHVIGLRRGQDPEHHIAVLLATDEYLDHFRLTSTTVTASPNPAPVGQPVTLTVTVTANFASAFIPEGSVIITSGSTVVGTHSLDGNGQAVVITSSLGAGALEITASYLGSSFFSSSVGTLDQDVITKPIIDSVAPAGGAPAGGNTVVIAGFNFTDATAVLFGSSPATSFTVDSDNQISAVAPAGSTGVVDISVTTSFGTGTAQDAYAYTATPVLDSLNPAGGPLTGGNIITLTGSGFTGTTSVLFGSAPAATFTVDSDTQISAKVPAGSGTVTVTVTNPLGTSGGKSYDYTTTPTISSVSPSGGPTAGGNTVTINGNGFSSATSVLFDATPATSFSVISNTQITAVVPAGSVGKVNVQVITSTGLATRTNAYTYADGPEIATIAPASGPTSGGNVITISGANFDSTSSVTFGGAAASFTVVNSSTLSVVAPSASSGSVDVVVTNAGGSATASDGYTYVTAPGAGPFSPNQGPMSGGTFVTFNGTNFTNAISVTVGGKPVTILSNTPTSITFNTPAGAGVADVTVTTAGGSSTSAGAFYYLPAPVVTGLSASAGPSAGGNTITISGVNLTTASSVTFGSNSATPTIINDSTISVVVPASGFSGSTYVTVTTAGGVATASTSYLYVDVPTIQTASPTAGPTAGGNVITITGTNFSTTSSVTIGGVVASFTVVNSTTLTAVAPPGSPGSVDVEVTTAGGSATATEIYTYVAAPADPISPNQGPTSGGTTVFLTGVNLANATLVTFGGKPATILSNTPTMITVIAPAGTGVVEVLITTAGGVSNPEYYYYIPAPILVSLSASAGPVAGGNTITLKGYNLSTATSVSFGGNTATPTIINDGEISVTVPAGVSSGTVNVSVTTVGGTTVWFNYQYVDAPTITSLSPTSGSISGGTTVTIFGTNLSTTTSVTIGGVLAAFGVINSTTLAVITPSNTAGSVDIVITTLGGSATVVDGFTYVAG